MGITNKPGQNTRRGVGRIGGGVEEELNKLSPGIGTTLVRELNQKLAVIGTRLAAQAGHHGTVEIVGQKAKDANAKLEPGLKLNSNRIAGVDDPIDNEDAVNLRYFRRFQNCDWFAQMAEDCLDFEEMRSLAGTTVKGIIPWFFGYSVYPPAAADTFADEGGTSGNVYLFPFSLQEDARVSQVVFNLPTFGGTVLSIGKLTFGLYDTDYNLVCDIGTFHLVDPDTGIYKVGVQVVDLVQGTIDIPAGGYFFAYSCTVCMHIWMAHFNIPALAIWNKGNVSVFGGTVVSGWVGIVAPGTLTDDELLLADSVSPPTSTSSFATNQGVPLALFCVTDLSELSA